jgi:hypothetical protein
VLRATLEDFQGSAYTSARLKTLHDPAGGRIQPPKDAAGRWVDGGVVRVQAAMQLPVGTAAGTWPAFWMLPSKPVRTHRRADARRGRLLLASSD